jgi:murein DD-endopeptidase MepM/ murein hydrolase activator NlpD
MLGVLLVVVVCAGGGLPAHAMIAAAGSSTGAATGSDDLNREQQQLVQVKARIRARAARMRRIQRDLNRLATQIAKDRSSAAHLQARIDKLSVQIAALDLRNAQLQAQLNARTREAYILGPGAPILYLMTATSTEDIVSRLSFLDELNHRDAVLAARVVRSQARLADAKAELTRVATLQRLAVKRARRAQRALDRELRASRRLFEELANRKDEVLYAISKIRPFGVCPVDGPHAIADNFGVWVQHPKKEGGDHVHQGDDIASPLGTPIVAPFDGEAVLSSDAANPVGGLSVKVYGEFGYVYNAHLSELGQLGAVSQGDVIGYVGQTGNAGGPHDHFEWHPDGGSAVDPYDFLTQVC